MQRGFDSRRLHDSPVCGYFSHRSALDRSGPGVTMMHMGAVDEMAVRDYSADERSRFESRCPD